MRKPNASPSPIDDIDQAKPAKSGRFEKGRSGNPRGRPKSADRSPAPPPLRAADKPTQAFFESEAYRPIARSDGGPDMPANQAWIRTLQKKTAQGSRLAAQYLLDHSLKAEALAHQEAKENFDAWFEYQKAMRPIVSGRPQPYWPSQDLLPHPDDLHFGPGLEVSILGPVDESAAANFDAHVALRDVWLKLDAYQAPDLERQRRRAARKARLGLPRYARTPPLYTDACVRGAWLMAAVYNLCLPRRFRLDGLSMEAKRLEADQIAPDTLCAQIRAEFARLRFDPPEPLGVGRFVAQQSAMEIMKTVHTAWAQSRRAA